MAEKRWKMLDLSQSELLLWGGIAVMAISTGVGIISIALSAVTGRKLKKKLEKEYGKPQR